MSTKKVAAKSLVSVFFDKWLALMEEAYYSLSVRQFQELEDKIISQIKAGRK